MPCIIISDGHIYRKNMERIGLNEKKLKKEISSLSLGTVQDIFLCFSTEHRSLYFYPKSDSSHIDPVISLPFGSEDNKKADNNDTGATENGK